MSSKLPKRAPRNWHPRARQLYTCWLGEKPKDILPSRQDIDPVEMKKILPNIYITEVVWADGKPRVKFRLVGTRIVERFGHDIGGEWMDEAYDQDYFAEVWPAYLAMIESKIPALLGLERALCQKRAPPLFAADLSAVGRWRTCRRVRRPFRSRGHRRQSIRIERRNRVSEDDTLPEKERMQRVWSRRGAFWDKHADALADMADRFNQPLLEFAGIGPGQRVLDLASGAGEPALSIARAVGPSGEVYATDIAPEMLAARARRAADAGLDAIHFEIADMEALPFAEGRFDRVTCRFGFDVLSQSGGGVVGGATRARAGRPRGLHGLGPAAREHHVRRPPQRPRPTYSARTRTSITRPRSALPSPAASPRP